MPARARATARVSRDSRRERAVVDVAVIAGGGTGGHVYPALAIADELVRRGHPGRLVRFVGSARGLEADAVPAAGYAIDLLPGRGLRRSLRPARSSQNAAHRASTHVVAVWRARSGSCGAGGPRWCSASAATRRRPAVLAARLRRIPVVVHEQNAAPGLVNRVAVALGARAAVSLPGTPLRGAVLTGNPVRAEIAAVGRRPMRAPRGTVPPRRVGVFGGSLGARRVNDATLDLADRWRDRADVSIRHVAGRARLRTVCGRMARGARRATTASTYELVAYEDDMEALYARAGRRGDPGRGGHRAELAVSGTPAVLVPLPGAPSDHQTANADGARCGRRGGRSCRDAELDGADASPRELDALLADPTASRRCAPRPRTLARPDAAARVADLVEEAAGDR